MGSVPPLVETVPGLFEVHRFGDGPARLVIEVPHGATERAHYDALAARLTSPMPARLEQFFHVNTDFGAPEIALRTAFLLTRSSREARKRGVVVIRALVPRTFVDLNRTIEGGERPGMTSGLPPYVTSAADRTLLSSLHRQYAVAVTRAYEEVCGAGGIAVALHTFAPRSVEVLVDAGVVELLRAAYRPSVYRSWKLRPAVDFITADAAGNDLSPPSLLARLKTNYSRLGLDVRENATYHLHPATMGHRFAARFPGQVLCVEYRRDLLGSPWRPFSPGVVGPGKIARLTAPLAESVGLELNARLGADG